MEVDEEEARAEMKTILKTFLIELELIYDEKFSSESNDEILRQIIPRLIEAMKPRYTPRYRQVKSWLAALHKHRRVRLLYKQRGTLDKDNRRLHQNNRDNRYHSPEYSESDEEQPDGKRHINVYNLSWRSEENTPADTDFSELKTLIQTMDNLIMAEDAEVSAEMDEIEVIEDSEPTGMEESEPTEESEPMGVKESEPIGVEESSKMEDETDKWYKFVL
ncbi:unnamed protein product [Rhizophagus irregularis]|nr:unnamed protein product [Rhizophagus irregularis]